MQNVLQQLKGARLSTFLALALNESEICLGRSTPLSIQALAAQTHLSPRSILRAVQDLAGRDFVTAEPERGTRREKLYRVSELARSGKAIVMRAASPKRPRTRHGTPTRHGALTRPSPSTTARVPTPHRKPRTDPDKLSRSRTAIAPVSSANPKIDPDTRACVSRRTRPRAPESTSATVPTSHRKPRTDPDKLSRSRTAIAPVSSTKSQIAPDTRACVSRSARSLSRTRTRTRTRARVVVAFRSSSSKSIPKSGVKQQQQFLASREIFAAVHVEGTQLVQLARTVDAALAQEWTERLEYAPQSFTDPVGFMIKHLLLDPTEAPPYAWQKPKQKTWYGDEFAKFVHGRPEHTQYCREHPDEVDCECGR